MLRLAPVVAAGRALFAAATVLASAQGHATAGHSHLDLPSVLFAFFMLLFVSWRTNSPRALCVAALAAQSLVHFLGAPMSGDTSIAMFAVHGIGAVVAWLLVWRFEALWTTATSALSCALHVLFGDLPTPTTAKTTPAFVTASGAGLSALVSNVSRRGPPAFA